MQICRYLCLILLSFLYLAIFIALCCLWGLSLYSLIGGVAILCIVFLGIFLLGERIILATVWAKKISVEGLSNSLDGRNVLSQNRADNLCCFLGLPRVEIYRAEGIPAGLYALRSFRRKAFLIIGGDIFSRLSQKEIDALIYLSILRIKHLNLMFITICNFFFVLIGLPALLLQRFACAKYVVATVIFFLLPLRNLKAATFKEESRKLEKLADKIGVKDIGYEIQSAHFKLNHLAPQKSLKAKDLLLAHLSTLA